jgi:dihydroflavonol-4-reductase
VRALVTGATGFVGSAVVRSLLRRGIAVRTLARLSSDLSNIAGLDVDVSYGDLLDKDTVCRALQGCDTLYHVAAYYSTTEADSQKMYEVNVHGTQIVMQAGLEVGVQRAVHTSTIGTIGQPMGGGLATEETPFELWETASHYVKSKYLGEVAALRFCGAGLPVIVVHPCAPVGARDIKPSSTGQRILDYLHGKLPSFVAGGINFVAVDDVAEGEVLAAEKGRVGERYILGHRDGNLLLADFCDLMERVSGMKQPPMPGHSEPDYQFRLPRWSLRLRRGKAYPKDLKPKALTCDPSKAIRELNLPQTSLAAAFAEAVQWFRENGYGRS